MGYKDIAYKGDPGLKFKNLPGSQKNDQWLDVEDGTILSQERFAVWMRISMTPRFRKLWGYIDQKLEIGKYRITIMNNWPVKKWNGEKMVVMSQANIFGGKNVFLCYVYLGFGAVLFLTSIIFGVRKCTRSKGILAEKLK